MAIETLIASVVGYLANSLNKSKGVVNAKDDLSKATWDWIKPIFIKDDKEQLLTDLIEKPNSNEAANEVKNHLTEKILSTPHQKDKLLEIYSLLKKNDELSERKIQQNGEKSLYIENNTGNININ